MKFILLLCLSRSVFSISDYVTLSPSSSITPVVSPSSPPSPSSSSSSSFISPSYTYSPSPSSGQYNTPSSTQYISPTLSYSTQPPTVVKTDPLELRDWLTIISGLIAIIICSLHSNWYYYKKYKKSLLPLHVNNPYNTAQSRVNSIV